MFADGSAIRGRQLFLLQFQRVDAAQSLCQEPDPVDVLLAEPVGSCTDLSATIVQPIKDRYADVFSIGPLSVLIDPLRAMAVLGEKQDLLHPSAAYIYRKQLEEADRIVVNKSDLLDSDARQRLKTLLQSEFPEREISFVSCQSGDGLPGWLTEVMSDDESGRRILDIDYDTYAEGEAVLGWLNARFGLSAESDMDWADFGRRYLEAVRKQLQSVQAQVGHVKLFLSTENASLTANLTALDGPVLIQKSNESFKAKHAEMTYNARAQIDPRQMQRMTFDVFRSHFAHVTVQTHGMQSLRPGRPQPTFRYSQRV